MVDTSNGSPAQDHEGLDLVASLRSKLQNASPFSSKCCIYQVPERIYHENPRAYTPRVVSIGPIHRGREALKAMEEQKLLYLKSFLLRTSLSLEEYARFSEEREQKVRDHYSERFEGLKSREFVEMVVVDVAFLAELLWRNHDGAVEESDRLFKKPWKVVDVRYDLMLLENQLPFFVLEDLFELAKIRLPLESNGSFNNYSLSAERISLVKLTHKFFRFKAYLGERDSVDDFLRRFHVPRDIPPRTTQSSEIEHFIDFFRKFHVPRHIPPTSVIETLTIPSVTELYEAGVQFEAGPTRSLFEIEFRGRTLVIPLLRIRRSTESFFLNLLAYEQCHSLNCYVNDYVFVIDRLIDSAKAVQILAQKGVIETKLSDHQEVVASIDSLIKGSILRRKHFHFNKLCESLKAYLSNPWHKRITMVKHTHFSSPITVFAVVVASAIFVLTVLQTICSCGVQFK